jgi:hypothetical protein
MNRALRVEWVFGHPQSVTPVEVLRNLRFNVVLAEDLGLPM